MSCCVRLIFKMEGAVCKTPGFLCETPSGEQCFKFPPALPLSVDRVKTSACHPLHPRIGRTSTPYRSSLFVPSPEFSPIKIPEIERDLLNEIRLPKEKIRKAHADRTVCEETALQVPTKLRPEGLENFLRYTSSGADNQSLRLRPSGHSKRSRKSMPATTRRNFIPKVREKSLRRLSDLSELKSSKTDLDQRVIRWLSHHSRRESRVCVDPNESVSVVSGVHTFQHSHV